MSDHPTKSWIHYLDPEFGRRSPPNRFERVLIAAVKAITMVIGWLTRRLPEPEEEPLICRCGHRVYAHRPDGCRSCECPRFVRS